MITFETISKSNTNQYNDNYIFNEKINYLSYRVNLQKTKIEYLEDKIKEHNLLNYKYKLKYENLEDKVNNIIYSIRKIKETIENIEYKLECNNKKIKND